MGILLIQTVYWNGTTRCFLLGSVVSCGVTWETQCETHFIKPWVKWIEMMKYTIIINNYLIYNHQILTRPIDQPWSQYFCSPLIISYILMMSTKCHLNFTLYPHLCVPTCGILDQNLKAVCPFPRQNTLESWKAYLSHHPLTTLRRFTMRFRCAPRPQRPGRMWGTRFTHEVVVSGVKESR